MSLGERTRGEHITYGPSESIESVHCEHIGTTLSADAGVLSISIELLSDGIDQRRDIVRVNEAADAAVQERIDGAVPVASDYRSPASHCLDEYEPETFSGRWHDEQISTTVGARQELVRHETSEVNGIGNAERMCGSVQTLLIVASPDDYVAHIGVSLSQARQSLEYPFNALISLARVEPRNRQNLWSRSRRNRSYRTVDLSVDRIR